MRVALTRGALARALQIPRQAITAERGEQLSAACAAAATDVEGSGSPQV
jgi:hypothetical protein